MNTVKNALCFCIIILLAISYTKLSAQIIPWQYSFASNLSSTVDTISATASGTGAQNTATTNIAVSEPCNEMRAGIKIKASVTKWVLKFGIQSLNNSYLFQVNGTSIAKYRNDTLIGSSISSTNAVGDEFIIKMTPDTLRILKNGTSITYFTGIQNGPVKVLLRLQTSGLSVYNTVWDLGDCALDIPNAELKNKLDGGCFRLDYSLLRFRFPQEYYTTGNNDDITYTIYDWQRTASATGSFLTSYGNNNWEAIDVSSLSSNTVYTLEVTANKGKKYYLRFKTP